MTQTNTNLERTFKRKRNDEELRRDFKRDKERDKYRRVDERKRKRFERDIDSN